MSTFTNILISGLDTPKSLTPFFIKDAFDISGRTIMAQREGGKHEAREKFIEETGTSLFWIAGIPAVTALSNKIAKNKIDTEIDFKRINTKGIQNYFVEELTEIEIENKKKLKKDEFLKKELSQITTNGKNIREIKTKLKNAGYFEKFLKNKYRTYHIGVSVVAVAINFMMLTFVLPKFNLFLSRKIISKEVKGEQIKQKKELAFSAKNKITISDYIEKSNNKTNEKKKNISFGSSKDLFSLKKIFDFKTIAENAQHNPTNSMLLLDYGIATSRVAYFPRDNNERIENFIKESGIILFFYNAAEWIKKGLSFVSNKIFKKPIDLDYKILGETKFLDKLKKAKEKNKIYKFINNPNEINIIKFIDKELAQTTNKTQKADVFKTFTLQMAQKQGLIDVEYDSELGKWIRHSKKYIETEKVTDINKGIKNFCDNLFGKAGQEISSKKIEQFVHKTQAIKGLSVIANIGICCLALSYVIPKIQYTIRQHRTKTKEAPGIKVYKEMAQKNLI